MKKEQPIINCTKITEQVDFFNDKIGLIIPAYNAHSTIKKLFHSIAMFNFLPKIEVCLIDDKSDYSYDYLYGLFPEVNLTIIKNIYNYGPGYSRNRGIEWAIKKDLPFIMFADADDYFINFDFCFFIKYAFVFSSLKYVKKPTFENFAKFKYLHSFLNCFLVSPGYPTINVLRTAISG